MRVRYLIDTHCWLWCNADVARLSAAAREIIADGGSEIVFSVASGWEISIKYALGKLVLPDDPVRYLPMRLSSNRMQLLSIQLHHVLAVARLPHHHRDPFDRVLIAQAQQEGLTIITADKVFQQYDVVLL